MTVQTTIIDRAFWVNLPILSPRICVTFVSLCNTCKYHQFAQGRSGGFVRVSEVSGRIRKFPGSQDIGHMYPTIYTNHGFKLLLQVLASTKTYVKLLFPSHGMRFFRSKCVMDRSLTRSGTKPENLLLNYTPTKSHQATLHFQV